MGFTTEAQRTQRIMKQGKTLETLCVLRDSVVKIFVFLGSLGVLVVKILKSFFQASVIEYAAETS